jgi:hypothetical protein
MTAARPGWYGKPLQLAKLEVHSFIKVSNHW